VQLAERAAAGSPDSRDSLLVRGAALYRASQFEASVRALSAALNAPQGTQTPGRSSRRWAPDAFDNTGYELLFLAMAHRRLGHTDEARQWLDRAVRWMEQAPLPKTEHGTDNPDYTWNRRVSHEALRREAEAVLKGETP
jgi:hypothetical protein